MGISKKPKKPKWEQFYYLVICLFTDFVLGSDGEIGTYYTHIW